MRLSSLYPKILKSVDEIHEITLLVALTRLHLHPDPQGRFLVAVKRINRLVTLGILRALKNIPLDSTIAEDVLHIRESLLHVAAEPTLKTAAINGCLGGSLHDGRIRRAQRINEHILRANLSLLQVLKGLLLKSEHGQDCEYNRVCVGLIRRSQNRLILPVL